MRKMLRLSTIVMILGFCIASCKSNSAFVFDDSNCTPPCWRGIEIGSPKEETIAALKGMPDIQSDSYITGDPDNPFDGDSIFWLFRHRPGGAGEIQFRGEKVEKIILDLMDGIPISAFIQEYGEPETVLLTEMQLDNIVLNVYFFYPEKGICLEHHPNPFFVKSHRSYSIDSSTQVFDITYTNPEHSPANTYEACMRGFFGGELPEQVQKWEGYGEYRVFRR
jgi:hypothetical protein